MIAFSSVSVDVGFLVNQIYNSSEDGFLKLQQLLTLMSKRAGGCNKMTLMMRTDNER
jgi:hypothetical protein